MKKKRLIASNMLSYAQFRPWQTVLSLVLALLLSGAARGQAVLQKDLKKDFGAVGDGVANDQVAFQKAADFFNKRAQTPAGTGRAVLRIPKGIYLVNPQATTSNGTDVLHLTGCRNLSVLGDDSATTEIRYASGLRYGSFDPATKLPYEAPLAYFTEGSYGQNTGICLVLQNCDNVLIAGLRLNGNSPQLVVGGHWGDTGIQLGADGVFVSESRRITLRKLAVHHFGRDGIQVLNHLAKTVDDPAQEAILLENSRFDYNGRQGLSITGVNGLQAVNCSFSHTGRVVIPATGRALYSNPGAGVDLEPEGGFVTNVQLDNCRFVDNAGQGIVSDRYGNGLPTTKHIVISRSLVWGVTNWSAWVRQTDFLFKDCRIYGAFVTGCAVAAYPTRFEGCTFEDRPYHGQPAYGQHLVYSNQEARAMRFTRCQFVGTHNYLLFATPAAADTASRFRLRDCTFTYDYAEPPLGGTNTLSGAVLSGNTTFQNGPHRTSPQRSEFVFGNAGQPGSAIVEGGSTLQLMALGSRYLLPAGLDVGRTGRASVVVGADNALVISEQSGKTPELYIGPNASVVVKKGGALEIHPHTKVIVAGQLLVEDGAYFYQDLQAEVMTSGQGKLVIQPGVIKSKHPAFQEAYSQDVTPNK